MDVEFHYYLTHLASIAGGRDPDESQKIAYSSQYLDHNVSSLIINKGSVDEYKNYISQTNNILFPRRRLRRIYPVFHFIPGGSGGNVRRDGKTDSLITTPDSDLANKLMDQALDTGNPYRIGIALHGYADTWAHQNFTGTFSKLNKVWKWNTWFLPSVGHAGVFHDPDLFDKVWEDPRIINCQIFNVGRHWKALRAVYKKLVTDKPLFSEDEFIERLTRERRISKNINTYISTSLGWSGYSLPKYDRFHWFTQAVKENKRMFRDAGSMVRILRDKLHWKDNHRDSDWYKFQESVKDHQREVLSMFRDTRVVFPSSKLW